MDPARFTPRYDRRLVAALRRQGVRATLLWSPAVHRDSPSASGEDEFVSTAGNGAAVGVHTEEVAFARTLAQTPWRQMARRVPWLRRGLRGLHYPLDQASLIDRVRATPGGLIHLQWALAPWIDSWVVRALRRDVPVVLTAHNVLPHEERPWHPAAYRHLYAAVDAVVVHSQAARERVDAVCPSAAVTVLPMPAGGWQAADADTSAVAARARLGLPDAGPIVLFFGLRRPYKGLPVLLDAWAQLSPRLPAAHLVAAGPGPTVEAIAGRPMPGNEGPAASHVWDRPDFILEEVVDDYFHAADVVALPYLRTDDSAVLAMALSAGRPVVVTDVGGLPEAAGEAGVVVPSGDPEALANALERILTSADLRGRLKDATRRRAASRTWDDFARDHLDLYARARRRWTLGGS